MLFKRKLRDKEFFKDMLRSLSAYEFAELIKAMAEITTELNKVTTMIHNQPIKSKGKNKDNVGFA